MRYVALTLVSAALFVQPSAVEAGLLSQLLRKGADMVTRGSAKAGKEVAKSGVRKIANTGVRTVGRGTVAPAKQAGRQLVLTGNRTLATGSVRSVVIDRLGIEGGKAMQRLTPTAARRMAEVSEQLARSPHKNQWLSIIQKYGDAAANFIWNNKGAIVVAAGSTAVLVAPEDFLKASGKLMETTVSVTGESIVRPIVTETTRSIAGPVAQEFAKHAAASFPWEFAWGIVGLSGLCVGGYWFCRRRLLR